MAKTKTLNQDDSVYVTTFYGGKDKGCSYQFTVCSDGVKASRVFTERELFALMYASMTSVVSSDNGVRPAFDG